MPDYFYVQNVTDVSFAFSGKWFIVYGLHFLTRKFWRTRELCDTPSVTRGGWRAASCSGRRLCCPPSRD